MPREKKSGRCAWLHLPPVLLGAWNLEHLLFEVGLHAAHLGFGLGAFLAALFLNLDDFVEGSDQRFIRVFQGFDVYDAAFGFARHLYGGGVQHFGILSEQLVGHVGDGILSTHGFG